MKPVFLFKLFMKRDDFEFFCGKINFMKTPPLIVTLKIDAESFDYFDSLRRRYFPPERNFLSAHLTLFHHLPGEELEKVRSHLINTGAAFDDFPLDFKEWRMLGKGVAIKVESPQLTVLHTRLSKLWNVWLTAQDRQKLQPHITVQNKVAPDRAKELYETLCADWQPRTGKARGLQLWHYLGGDWKLEKEFLFGE